MKRWIAIGAAACMAATPIAAEDTPADLLALVDPFIGADGGGNTVPGATVPFGFVWLSPDTTDGSTSGYGSKGDIIGFSHTHVSGTGGGSKYGNFRVTPAIGGDAMANLGFPKAQERASPGTYSVVIGRPGKRIRAELTASRLVGVSRYTFPASDDARLVLDVSASIPLMGGGPKANSASVTIDDARHLHGQGIFTGGFGGSAEKPVTLYFAADYDRPAFEAGRFIATQGHVALVKGPGTSTGGDQRDDMHNRLGSYARFDTRQDRTVTMRLAVSWISVDQARRTLAAAETDFNAARADATAAWSDALGTIEIEGGTPEQRRIFASALYRSQTMPHDLTGENVWWHSEAPHYEDFYTVWDTFRTLNPLLTLIAPDRERGMIRSLLDTYDHEGWLPDARIAGSNGPTQGGTDADVMIGDAIVKHLGGFDAEHAYAAIRKDAEVDSPDPLNVGRDLGDYVRLGYMSLDKDRSASRTLEYAANDYAIAAAATALGHDADAARYGARSRTWAALWDDALKCVRPRYADGRWLENFDCDHEYPDQRMPWWSVPFYEGSSAQYSTYVPHDVSGLMAKVGGREAFVGWLDRLFDERLYTHNNEPDLLAPFLYIYAGRPDRTATRVRAIMANDYAAARDGLPGNDDAGTMSSWYVWAAIGLFPNAGQPLYYIASPVFSRTVIHLEHGRRFVIDAPATLAANLYVQSATLDGKPLNRAWLTHEEIASGGTLRLEMGPTPSAWGTTEPPPNGLDLLERE
jgi:predicted alpha-1,2-mannosidase